MRDIAGEGDVEDKYLIPAHKVVDITGMRPSKRHNIAKCENVLNETYIVSERPFGARPGKPMRFSRRPNGTCKHSGYAVVRQTHGHG